MAILCVPNNVADKITKELIKRKITTEKLVEMKSDKRRELFQKITDENVGVFMNEKFEKKMADSRKKSLDNWINKTFSNVEKRQIKDVISRISELTDQQLLNDKLFDNVVQDLVSGKLGLRLSPEQTKKIVKLTQEMQDTTKDINKSITEMDEEGIDYFKKRKELVDYMQSLTPTKKIKIVTQLIGRGAMLASIKSPILNILSNLEMTISEGIVRRIKQGKLTGLNSDLIKQYVQYGMKIYKKSGYDISRMIHLSDDQKRLGENVLSSQGKGIIRKVGRLYEDTVFKYLMGAPDIATSLLNFADSANIHSSTLAKEQFPNLDKEQLKQKAREIFLDALSFSPKTEQGSIVREAARKEAEFSTFTNESTVSRFSEGIRRLINKATGEIGLGENIMPFVRTPANVVNAILDYAGVNGILHIKNIPNAIKQIKLGNRAEADKIIKSYVRAGLGFTLAFALVQAIDPDDFMGEFPLTVKEQELMRLKNATPNSIRIGNKWVSLDYLGPVGGAFTGIMTAKKEGKSFSDKVFRYGQGVSTNLLRIPGVRETYDILRSGERSIRQTKDMDVKKIAKGMAQDGIDFLRSRTIPAIVSDIAKATDEYKRIYDRESLSEKTLSNLPITRKSLPIATNIFGEKVKEESAINSLLFGSRFKTANLNPIVIELNRLSNNQSLPAISSLIRSNKQIKELKDKIGFKKLIDVVNDFGVKFYKEVESEIKTQKYKDKSDEEKRTAINKIKNKILRESLVTAFDLEEINKLKERDRRFYIALKKREIEFQKKFDKTDNKKLKLNYKKAIKNIQKRLDKILDKVR